MLALIDGDPLVYTASWGKATPGDAKAHLRWLVNDAIETTMAEDYLIAIGNRDSSRNFRCELFPFYKKSATRQGSKEKLQDWFPKIKDCLAGMLNVYECDGYEADDQLRIWAGEAERSSDPFVIHSIDKDLDAIVGLHYNSKRKEFYKVPQEYADWFFWKQCLMGDSIDNIPGIPRVGPVTADNILAPGKNWDDWERLTVTAYKGKYGDQWWEYLMANARLLHIWRFHNDHFQLDKAKYD
jgi:hypothetical protein